MDVSYTVLERRPGNVLRIESNFGKQVRYILNGIVFCRDKETGRMAVQKIEEVRSMDETDEEKEENNDVYDDPDGYVSKYFGADSEEEEDWFKKFITM